MGQTQTLDRLDAQAYLDWEAQQPDKHEFVAGQVYAMVGARDAHVTTALNVASTLKGGLRGGPCRVYISDMKLRVEAEDAFFYPDVLVSCDPRDRAEDRFKAYPVLLVEVLSESTAAYDRGRKFAAYRTLATLEEYVLADPASRTVDVFRRDEAGRWVLYAYAGEDTVELASVEVRIPLAAVFEDVEAPGAEAPGAGPA
jgi:Uma2 family endonuclease